MVGGSEGRARERSALRFRRMVRGWSAVAGRGPAFATGAGGRRPGARLAFWELRAEALALPAGRAARPLSPGARSKRPAGSPWATPSGTGSRERLYEWSSSFRAASSCVVVVTGALYLALSCRCGGESVVPLGRRAARRRLPVTTRAPLVVVGSGANYGDWGSCGVEIASLAMTARAHESCARAWRPLQQLAKQLLDSSYRGSLRGAKRRSRLDVHRHSGDHSGARVVTGESAARIPAPERHDDASRATGKERDVQRLIHHGRTRARQQVAR